MHASHWLVYSSLLMASFVTNSGLAEVLADGQTHDINAEFASLEVRDGANPTSVDLTENGKVSHLTAYDNSFVRNLDGRLSHARFLDSSMMLAEGGNISHLHIAASSAAILSGGTIDHSTAYDAGHIEILGDGLYHFVSAVGTFESHGSETANDTSEINIFAGDVGIAKAKAGGVVNIHGGSVYIVDQGREGTFNIHGGSIRHISLDRNSVTNIYGEGLELSFSRFIHDSPTYLLSGTLADGTAATAEVFHFETAASLNLINVPESSCLVLFGLCVATLSTVKRSSRRKTTSNSKLPIR